MTTTEHRPDTTNEQRGKGALPWIVLGLVLALGALGAYLLVGSGDGTATDTPGETAQGEDAAPGTAEDAAGSDTDGSAPSADARPGVIAAGGATVYPLQESLQVADFDGIEVVATNVPVESVAGEGFWVGTTPQDRVYVVADDTAGLEPGALVSFTGVVRRHGEDFATGAGVGDGEGAERLNNLRGHVVAEDITVTQ